MRGTARHVLNSLIMLVVIGGSGAHAQITLDGSMGTAGALTGPNFTIPSTVGQTRGSNLFHSFGLFNVLTNQSATFTGPNSISNIFSRVTGGQQSIIDGRIRSTILNANLYLMNPAGMMFGPNALLDVRGSFHATTADYLKFADGAKFHADLSRQSTLTSAPVSAFGFLSQNPAGILVLGSVLHLNAGQTLSIVGGDIDIVGDPLLTSQGIPTLSAFGGKVQLASVASPGEIPLNLQDLNLGIFERPGEINLSKSAYIDVSNYNGGAVGSVVIRGGRLSINSSFVFADNQGIVHGVGDGVDVHVTGEALITNHSLITARNQASGRGRDVLIRTDTFTLASESLIVGSSVGSTGNAGTVVVEAKNVTVTGGAQIASPTFGAGNGATVSVKASDTISLDGLGSQIGASSEPGSTGNAGTVVVEAKNVRVTGGAAIASSTFGAGNGGSVSVKASDTISLSESLIAALSQPGSTGNAGTVLVEAKNVAVTRGAAIASATFGSGKGGTVSVKASDTISVDGFESLIVASSQPGSTGNAGDLVVEARNVTLTGGAQIRSTTSGSGNGGTVAVRASDTITLDGTSVDGSESLIVASSQRGSTGNAGALVVEAKNVTVTGGAQIQSGTSGSGNGGTVAVKASDTITLSESLISAASQPGSTGNAGALVVEAKNVTVTGGAAIASFTSGSGKGGTVAVKASDTINLEGFGSLIAASSAGTGNAGDLVVEAKNLSVTGGAQIGSSTFGAGNGGTVSVKASDTISLDGISVDGGIESQIVASSQRGSTGNAGNLVVEAKNVTVTGGAAIASSTFGSGDGGTVSVKASDTISLDGIAFLHRSLIVASSQPGSTGNAGALVVEAKNVTVTGGAQIQSGTSGSGKGGTVSVKAVDTISLDGFGALIVASSLLGSTGNAGDLVVEAKNVMVTGGAQIGSTTSGSGNGGTVAVRASDTITLDGTSVDGSESLIVASSQRGSTGNAGALVVEAKNVTVTGGAQIQSGTSGSGKGGTVAVKASDTITLSESLISAASQPGSTGNAGALVVEAKNVTVTGGAVIASDSFGSGTGGTVSVKASDTISLTGHALITATSSGTGNAGDIVIEAREFHSANSSVTTDTAFADGGNIHVKVSKLVELTNSQITTSVLGGQGQGGNITIDPQFLVLNHSQISANAFGGPGGNITIVADNFLASPDSSVTASSALSTPGTVDIQAPIVDLTGSIAPLPEAIVQVSTLLRQSCATRYSSGKASSLAAMGRDSTPWEPGGLLSSSLFTSANFSTSRDTNEAILIASAHPKFSIASPCVTLY